MNKVTFGKRDKSIEEDTQPILLDGVEVGTLYARRTNNHHLTIGLCPSPSNPFVWSQTQYFIQEYAVLFCDDYAHLNDSSNVWNENVWDLSKNGYKDDARAVLSEVKKWVRAALAPAPVALKAGEPLPVLKLRSWADPAPAPAPVEAPVEAPAPAPVQEKKRARRKSRPNLTDYKNLARRALGVRDVDSFSYEVITIDIDPLTGQGVNYLDHFEGRSLRSVPVGVPCYLKLWEDEHGFSLFDDLRFMIDPESGEALLIEFGKNGTGERARALLRTMGHTWAPAPAPLPMAAEIDSEALGPVTYDDVAGLLACAFEGGSNYWARVKVAYDPSEEELNSPAFDGWEGFRAYTITHPYWEIVVRCDHRPRADLKLPDLLKGLRIMRRDYPRHWADFMAGNQDATTGDVFLQCAALGELVYG